MAEKKTDRIKGAGTCLLAFRMVWNLRQDEFAKKMNQPTSSISEREGNSRSLTRETASKYDAALEIPDGTIWTAATMHKDSSWQECLRFALSIWQGTHKPAKKKV